jgi:hypothetical protein
VLDVKVENAGVDVDGRVSGRRKIEKSRISLRCDHGRGQLVQGSERVLVGAAGQLLRLVSETHLV